MRKQELVEEDDPRFQSKCTTPKQMAHPHSLLFSRTKAKNSIDSSAVKVQFQRESRVERGFQKKVEDYRVISDTLGEFIKQNRSKGLVSTMNTSIQIIKAFSKTQVSEVSPNADRLIQDMLGTLSIKKRVKEKGSKQKPKPKKQTSLRSKEQKKEPKQRSASVLLREGGREAPLPEIRELGLEIEQLEQKLARLQEEGQALNQLKEDLAQMNDQEKKAYLKELEQIVLSQKAILEQLQGGTK